MANFITVHAKGQERMINLALVSNISPCREHTLISFVCYLDTMRYFTISVDEPYDVVKMMVMREQIGEE